MYSLSVERLVSSSGGSVPVDCSITDSILIIATTVT